VSTETNDVQQKSSSKIVNINFFLDTGEVSEMLGQREINGTDVSAAHKCSFIRKVGWMGVKRNHPPTYFFLSTNCVMDGHPNSELFQVLMSVSM
jgi:hypothetical protein